ncbi:hypothetical protein [Haliscomenobacter sp.]|uniref:hypothetical protein n=1 Tax=Haliscomenobacter sp. TaxID=2717303 RepID=UPI00359488D8
MPKTTNAEANRKIKQIASMAGITTPATENGVTAPKWTFVRTHTARRSAVTNLAMRCRWILLLSWGLEEVGDAEEVLTGFGVGSGDGGGGV